MIFMDINIISDIKKAWRRPITLSLTNKKNSFSIFSSDMFQKLLSSCQALQLYFTDEMVHFNLEQNKVACFAI